MQQQHSKHHGNRSLPTSPAAEQEFTAPRTDRSSAAALQQFSNPHLPSAHRQQAALTISSQLGNAFLQRMLSTVVQRHGEESSAAATASAPANAPTTTLSTEVETVLNASAQGKEALATLSKYKVTLEINDSNAPQFLPDTNVCKLNAKMSAEVTASYFIHEMYHAKMHHTGQSLDANSMEDNDENRKKFIDQHVTEEIVGTYKGVEGILAFEESGRIKVESAKSAVPCYDDYARAYNNIFDKKIKAGEAKADAQASAQKMARYAIRLYFDDPEGMVIKYKPFGGVLTYREHYAREWDRTQRKKQQKP